MEAAESDALSKLQSETQSWKLKGGRRLSIHRYQSNSQYDKSDPTRTPSAAELNSLQSGANNETSLREYSIRANKPIIRLASHSIENQTSRHNHTIDADDLPKNNLESFEDDDFLFKPIQRTDKLQKTSFNLKINTPSRRSPVKQALKDSNSSPKQLTDGSGHDGPEFSNSGSRPSNQDNADGSEGNAYKGNLNSPTEGSERPSRKPITIIRNNPKKELDEMLKKTSRKVVVRSISLRGNKDNLEENMNTKDESRHCSSLDNRRPQPIQVTVIGQRTLQNIDEENFEDDEQESSKVHLSALKRNSTARRQYLGHESPIKKRVIENQMKDKEFLKEHSKDNDEDLDQGTLVKEVSLAFKVKAITSKI